MHDRLETPAKLGLVTRGALTAKTCGGSPWLAEFFRPSELETERPETAGAILAWGRKPSASKAEEHARKHRLPLLRIEDAFIRSVGFGPHEKPLGIVLDDEGIYYDASKPSRLESLIDRPLLPAEEQRARQLVAAWREGRVSKYNHAREYAGPLPEDFVLVADQTRGDSSILFGRAHESSFGDMLEAALGENPDSTILLKVHPEVLAGDKRGHFNLGALRRNPRIRLLGEDVHPVRLLQRARRIYTVTSQIGFEGLLWGKEVRTFGAPFYAGWGLTTDQLGDFPRRRGVKLEQLVHAALIRYARYVDPEPETPCEVEQVIAHLALQRLMIERYPRHLHAFGISRWKRVHVRRFFPYSSVVFVKSARRIPTGATVVCWGRGPAGEKTPAGVDTLRLEDGFIRSVGLGAEFTPPVSWVADPRGIYFDATSTSQLEAILQQSTFDTELLSRARALGEALVAAGVTKYNVGRTLWRRPDKQADVILVPGQVESDASILYGSPVVQTNLDLLRNVRAAHPRAFIVYKPHPDVVAGLRTPGAREAACAQWCDEIVADAPMGKLLEEVDEVHTMTSLAGFEGLLRRKRVVTYGHPFYAGWGLTEDQTPLARRSRQLTLDELVAGALFLYPLYISQATGRYTSPERALHELLSGSKAVIKNNPLESLLRRMISFKKWRKVVAR